MHHYYPNIAQKGPDSDSLVIQTSKKITVAAMCKVKEKRPSQGGGKLVSRLSPSQSRAFEIRESLHPDGIRKLDAALTSFLYAFLFAGNHRMKKINVAKSLCRTPETNIILLASYISI